MIKSSPKKLSKKILKSRPSKTVLKWIPERDFKEVFVVKLAREAYERHVDCGLHEVSDQKY